MGIAVVTGANSGIGLATALRLARDGHVVHAAMRDLDKAGDLRDRCAAEGLDGVSLLRLDVRDDHSVELAFEQVLEQSGPVDILVNNAGISQAFAIEEVDVDDFAAHLDTNVTGVLRCVKAVLPSMRERGAGSIVNISSVSGVVAMPVMGAYAASKFAVEALSESLAQEVAPFGIRVLVIQPGTINTPIFFKAPPPPEGSAYVEQYARINAYFGHTLRAPTDPGVVADVIAEAIGDPNAPFRHVVGTDAQPVLDGRRSMTDEEWIAAAALPMDEWHEQFARHFFDLRG